LDVIIDKKQLRGRVEELAAGETLTGADRNAMLEFHEAWQRHDKNPRE
jgi:hypothetical protein